MAVLSTVWKNLCLQSKWCVFNLWLLQDSSNCQIKMTTNYVGYTDFTNYLRYIFCDFGNCKFPSSKFYWQSLTYVNWRAGFVWMDTCKEWLGVSAWPVAGTKVHSVGRDHCLIGGNHMLCILFCAATLIDWDTSRVILIQQI